MKKIPYRPLFIAIGVILFLIALLSGAFWLLLPSMLLFSFSIPIGCKRRKEECSKVPYDRERQYAVMKCSICTGEMTAGFKDRETGSFTEVMLIKSKEDEKAFMEEYGLSEVKREY